MIISFDERLTKIVIDLLPAAIVFITTKKCVTCLDYDYKGGEQTSNPLPFMDIKSKQHA